MSAGEGPVPLRAKRTGVDDTSWFNAVIKSLQGLGGCQKDLGILVLHPVWVPVGHVCVGEERSPRRVLGSKGPEITAQGHWLDIAWPG